MAPSTAAIGDYPRAGASALVELGPVQARLLDAAAESFMATGYNGTSVDEVARSIGATKGAVYYHYRSKLDLLLGVCERGMLLLEERIAGALSDSREGDAAERLREVSTGQVENIIRHYAYHVVIQQSVEHRRQMPLRDSDRERLRGLDDMRDRHEALIADLIDQGIADGSLRPMDTRLAARTLLGGIVGVAIWYRPRPGQSEHDQHVLAAGVVDLLLAGLLRT